jgi:acyl CoA:acetate/3-ketoacid CoA transferase beta subunit
MAATFERVKHKIPGEQLIGYEGTCNRCKQTQKAYYIYADARRKSMMKLGTFMAEKANCPACVTHVISTPYTMQFTRKLSQKEVYDDLQILEQGMFIDFDLADSEAKKQERADFDAQVYEARTKEFVEWAKKKEN